MIKKIFKDIDFVPLHNYVENFKLNIIDINIEENSNFKFINCKLNNGLNLEIIIMDDLEKTAISFNYKNDIILEKVEFMILNRDLCNGINGTIRHDYWFIEDNVLTTHNSFYTYLNNEYKSGKESNRKVKFSGTRKNMFYDNISYLSLHIDDNNISLLLKEDIDKDCEPVIKTIMVDNKKYNETIQEFFKKDNDKVKIKK